METTFFMIKPEGLIHAEDIFTDLLLYNMNIVLKKEIIMSCDLMKGIYKNQSGKFFEANRDYLVGKKCILLIIEGHNVAERLYKLSGDNYNPSCCEIGTLRRKYGIHEPILHPNGRQLFLNAVHRSTPENSANEVSLILEYLGEKLL